MPKSNAHKARVTKTPDQPQLPTPDATSSTKKVDELSVETPDAAPSTKEVGGLPVEMEELGVEVEGGDGWASAEKNRLLTQLVEAKKEKEDLGRVMRTREQELEEKRLKSEAELTKVVEGLQAQLSAVVKYPSRERMTDPDGNVLALDEEADYWKEKYWNLDDKFAEICAKNEKKREQRGGKGKETKYIPPVTKKQAAQHQARKPAARSPPAPKTQPKSIGSGVTAIVVHGVHCQRPIAGIIQDAKYAGLEGVLGARWLLGQARREGKTTSSVVIYTSFEFVKLGDRIKFRGRWLPVNAYDPDRGRE